MWPLVAGSFFLHLFAVDSLDVLILRNSSVCNNLASVKRRVKPPARKTQMIGSFADPALHTLVLEVVSSECIDYFVHDAGSLVRSTPPATRSDTRLASKRLS